MKSLTSLVQIILEDIEYGCGTSTTRDFETIARRVENEGLSFLTITLPRFGQVFERSLDQGSFDSSSLLGFKLGKLGALPRLFGGLLSLVFDSKTGVMLDEPSICAIKDIRQICLMFKKVQLSCSRERTQAAYLKFVQTEQELIHAKQALAPSLLKEFEHYSRLIWTDRTIHSGHWLTADRKVCLQ